MHIVKIFWAEIVESFWGVFFALAGSPKLQHRFSLVSPLFKQMENHSVFSGKHGALEAMFFRDATGILILKNLITKRTMVLIFSVLLLHRRLPRVPLSSRVAKVKVCYQGEYLQLVGHSMVWWWLLLHTPPFRVFCLNRTGMYSFCVSIMLDFTSVD